MKKIVLIFAFSFNLISAQDLNLTLEESLSLGLKNSKELTVANSAILKSEASVSEISASMLPKLSLNASYARLSDVPPFQVNLPSLPQPITIQESILNNYGLNLKLEQPIFTGFKLSSLKLAAEKMDEANSIEYEQERITKIDNITKVFWQFYTAEQFSKLITENLSTLKKHLSNTESLLNNGLVTKNDLLKIKVEVSSAELKLVDALNNKELARALFNKTLGLPLNSETNITVDTIDLNKSEFDFNDLALKAQQNRQELKSTKLKIKALEQKEIVANSDWYPQLFAFAEFNYNNPNQRFMPLEGKFNDSWAAGLALKWDIWNWGGTSSKVEQAKQEYFQAETKFDLLKENVELDVYKHYLNLQKAMKKIDLSDLQVESAEENYRITKQKYYQQLATSTDLIDAETSLLNAKTTQLTTKVEYKIALSSLNKSVGIELN